MSDKHIGRIENSNDAAKAPQFSQPWTPQMEMPKMDTSGASSSIMSKFGNLQLVDSSQEQQQGSERQLKGHIQVQQEPEHGHPIGIGVQSTQVHHDRHRLSGHAHDTGHSGHQKAHQEYLVGQTTIPGSNNNGHYIPSEKLSATLPAGTYYEGERFNQILSIPAEKGKHNYYNGLANAHYEHGHLIGRPVHVVNGQVTAYLDHEVDIPLHKK
jgi:hypothetical protein